jgi:hypothetical protein
VKISAAGGQGRPAANRSVRVALEFTLFYSGVFVRETKIFMFPGVFVNIT